MMLRDSKVFAKCTDSGELAAKAGRVEIRYKQGESKPYSAGAQNLIPIAGAALLPDDACSDSSAATTASKAKSAKSSSAKKSAAGKIEHPENAAIAYADGACSGNPGPAGLGVVLMVRGERAELSEYLGHGTNNVAELTAIQRVAERCAGEKLPVHIYTDSSYSIGVLTKGWKAKANQELIAAVKSALREVSDVHLHYVPGHAGVDLNERADELARAAVQNRATTAWKLA